MSRTISYLKKHIRWKNGKFLLRYTWQNLISIFLCGCGEEYFLKQTTFFCWITTTHVLFVKLLFTNIKSLFVFIDILINFIKLDNRKHKTGKQYYKQCKRLKGEINYNVLYHGAIWQDKCWGVRIVIIRKLVFIKHWWSIIFQVIHSTKGGSSEIKALWWTILSNSSW